MAKATAGMTSSITRRWLRGGLLITMVLLVLAETLFLYSTYDNLYGSVRQAMFNRFSTIEGQLRATGTAGDTDETAYSRGRALRRIVGHSNGRGGDHGYDHGDSRDGRESGTTVLRRFLHSGSPYSTVNMNWVLYWQTRSAPSGVMEVVRISSR